MSRRRGPPALFLALAACAPAAPPTFDEVEARVFRPSCTASACHDATKRAGNLSLVPEEAYAQLVGVESDNAAAKAEGLVRVAPGDAAKSFLVVKLQDTVDPKYGHRMPDANDPLEDDRRELVESWIAAGAPR